jgi:uncharacterized protein (UPF0333 family)
MFKDNGEDDHTTSEAAADMLKQMEAVLAKGVRKTGTNIKYMCTYINIHINIYMICVYLFLAGPYSLV